MSGKGIRAICKNEFLTNISRKNSLQNWVDIEEEYYHELLKHLDSNPDTKEMSIYEIQYGIKYGIKELNKDFSEIKILLENYLSTKVSLPAEGLQKIRDNIYDNGDSNPDGTENILVLNFNYTKTENLYIDEKRVKPEIIHIHGELKSKESPIIFGYGDETGETYKVIENLNDKEFLKYMKSMEYPMAPNYKDLLAFIESETYEIFVMGHSCGLSDRVLLKTLFEHKNCHSIKCFYHQPTGSDGREDFGKLVRNISRHFDDKALFRKRIVNFKDTTSLT
ncbi:MAG: bacteriophage abortive infection AbiH family protein [Myxococcales bacterium]|nr:bacteriophage abortive infection AbiH family protein [Myxococcales bacterium]